MPLVRRHSQGHGRRGAAPSSKPSRRRAVPAVSAAAILAACLLTLAAPALAQPSSARPLPRVYVFTAVAKPGDPVPADQAARRASVDDLREALGLKPGLLQVVDIPLDADVLVEVLRREALPDSRCLLAVRLRAVGESAGRNFQGEGPSCKASAELVADIVRRWVNELY